MYVRVGETISSQQASLLEPSLQLPWLQALQLFL